MDNENLKNRIDELEKRLKLLEEAKNVNALKYWREAIIGQPKGANDAAVDTTLSITIGAGGGTDTEQILDFPDGFIELIKPNGDRVLVPTYNLSRF